MISKHMNDKSSVLGTALTLTPRGKCFLSRAQLHLEACDRTVALQKCMKVEIASLVASIGKIDVTSLATINVQTCSDSVQRFTKMAATLHEARTDCLEEAIGSIRVEMATLMTQCVGKMVSGWAQLLEPAFHCESTVETCKKWLWENQTERFIDAFCQMTTDLRKTTAQHFLELKESLAISEILQAAAQYILIFLIVHGKPDEATLSDVERLHDLEKTLSLDHSGGSPELQGFNNKDNA